MREQGEISLQVMLTCSWSLRQLAQWVPPLPLHPVGWIPSSFCTKTVNQNKVLEMQTIYQCHCSWV